jgi:hypothetical protein
MTNKTSSNQPGNQQNNQQQSNAKSTTALNESTSRADQPTPVSSQSQGTQNQDSQSGDLKQVGREIADEAKSAVSNAATEVKSQVSDMTHSAQEQANSFLGEQKDVAASRIEGVAEALRSAGQELAGRDEGQLAQYTDSLAGQLDNFSNTLRDREIGSLLDDAKQLAHRQPELFVAGMLAAGFVLGRFFKSSRRMSRSGNDYYGEYDPRDPSRMYGERYGQSYGQQFNQNYGPDYSRDYDAGYRASQQSEYGTYGQGYGQGQSYERNYEQGSRQQFGQQYGQGSSQQQSQQYSQGSSQQYRQGSVGPFNQRSGSQSQGQSQGQPTTHGLGTGQSIDREADLRKGQEFGQGEEQVSNRQREQTNAAQRASQENQRRDTSQEGDTR